MWRTSSPTEIKHFIPIKLASFRRVKCLGDLQVVQCSSGVAFMAEVLQYSQDRFV